MANASIKAAFEQFWTHVIARTGDMITQANEYTDTSLNTHTSNTSNPHSVTKAQVGLGNVDNTSDVNKPVSTATQTALNNKMNKTAPTGTGALSINRKSGTTVGTNSVAIGNSTTAEGSYSYAEGYSTIAGGTASHAEGQSTTTAGQASHAEGASTLASGTASHAEGYKTTALDYAHAEGYNTTALEYQHAQGHYNKTSSATAGTSSGSGSGTAFVIGCGTSSSAANAMRITYAGNIYAITTSITAGADYAEYFEWLDGNPNSEDRRGYFVTLDGKNIKIAEPNDYVLGIISGMPCVIGNGDEDWMGRYICDDFGAYIGEEFEYEEEVFDKETKEMKTVTKTGTKYKENPDYDPTMPYVQREDRPEWDAVGMMGVLSVRDDGTCQVNGYCTVAEGGTATASEYGYRVIERVNDSVVKVVFK